MTGLPPILAFAVSRWTADPFARGAYTVPGPGATPDDRAALAAPVSPRLVLAGEAANAARPAMVHGAWEDGRRAALWALAQGHSRVAVIGAGFAGLGAARALTEAGARATIIEARGRIGGRAWSRPLGRAVVESGANWLQGGADNPLRPLAAAAGLTLLETDFHAPLNLGPPRALAALALPGLAAGLAARLAAAPDPRAPLSDAVSAWIADPSGPGAGAIRRHLAAEHTLDDGLPPEEVSIAAAREPGVGDGDAWLAEGYGALAAYLAKGLDIRLNTPVRAIRDLARGIEVICEGATLSADAVIVTAPAPVLAAGGIAFDPPLPASHRAVLRALRPARVEKVSLLFERRWWPASPSGYLRSHGAAPEDVAEWLDLTDAAGEPILTGAFAAGTAGRIWADPDDAAVARAAARHLRAAVRLTPQARP